MWAARLEECLWLGPSKYPALTEYRPLVQKAEGIVQSSHKIRNGLCGRRFIYSFPCLFFFLGTEIPRESFGNLLEIARSAKQDTRSWYLGHDLAIFCVIIIIIIFFSWRETGE